LVDKQLETLAYRLEDLSSLRNLFSELNFDFADKPVNKDNWNDDQKKLVKEARIIASKDDYQIYYIQTNTDSLKEWKGISSKIIKDNHGLCMVCSHNPNGFKWVFSSLSKEFSKSFSETRHFPIDIKPDIGIPKTFVNFLEKIKISHGSTGTSIVSQFSEAFDSFAVQIHDELTINVFEALKTLSEGIILNKSNNLTLDEQTLEDIREQVFILLYRIIFILYAEDRGIFPTEQQVYEEKFSFKWLKENWILYPENQKKISEYAVQDRLWGFFRLIELGSENLGYDSKEFFMRAYYGRLFDGEINSKLDKWKIKNEYLLDAVSLLTRTRDKQGNYFFLDYSVLETRHLGSIYEHLLEYHLKVEENKICKLPDTNDRKSSGSYYTPEYIVDHIIQKTIDPLIEKILETNDSIEETIEKILSLKILDPAMGSGHFLISATSYLAKRICEIENKMNEEQYIERKRDVVRRCIYGVDFNQLAVDLTKVALWLETLSSKKPLSFLSAHIKHGNSLLYGTLEDIFDSQQTLFETKPREQLKKIVKDFIEFELLEDNSPGAVKIKIKKYGKIHSKGTFYHQIRGILDHKIAEKFGVKLEPWRDLRQKIGVESLDFYSSKSGVTVNELRNKHRFFHWDLEFPEIFYSEQGDLKDDAGFNAVIGNPPWNSKISKEDTKILAKELGWGEKNINICALFISESLKKLQIGGVCGFLLPKVVIKNTTYLHVRKNILENFYLKSIGDYGQFPGVASDAVSFIIQRSSIHKETEVVFFKKNSIIKNNSIDSNMYLENPSCIFSLSLTPEIQKILLKIEKNSIPLIKICKIKRGIEIGQQSNIVQCEKCNCHNEADSKYYSPEIKKCKKCSEILNLKNKFIISSSKKQNKYTEKCISGNQIKKYKIITNYFIPKNLEGISYKEESFKGNNIFVKRIATKIEGMFSKEKLLSFNTVYSIYNSDLNEIDLLGILAVLNSTLMNFYYEFSYNAGMNLTTQITTDFLKKIPMKFSKNPNFKNQMSQYVNEIIAINLKNEKKDESKIIDLERKIDDLVFQVYEINQKEIELIYN
jgi:hypothetical protein